MARSLELLHPDVKAACLELKRLAKEKCGLQFIVTQTTRTDAEQKALYAQGREPLETVNQLRIDANMPPISDKENKKIVTKAKTGSDSMHYYGLAFDIAITDLAGKKIKWDSTSDWNDDDINDWNQVGALADLIPGLEWGGNWTGMPDPPHYQMRFGLTLSDLKAGKRPEKN